MASLTRRLLPILFFALVGAVACGDDDGTTKPDSGGGGTVDSGGGGTGDSGGGGTGDSGGGGTSDSGGGGTADASTSNPSKLRVAAIQFAKSQYAQVAGCGNVMCALTKLMAEAAGKGAKIIISPEYAFDQKTAEQAPKQGDKIVGDSRWGASSILATVAALAVKHKVTYIINLITQEGSGSTAKLYNTMVAIGPQGTVLARHYKFHLFGNENTQLTAGTNVTSNFFNTPIGKVGLLICADIQCIVYGSGPDCPARNLKLLQEYTRQGAVATFFSAYWTVGPTNAGSSAWWPLNVQKKYSVDAKSWVIASNTSAGPGQGGGIFEPGGAMVTKSDSGKPAIIYADLPAKK